MRVRGEGPVPCTVMLVGESPGWEEDRHGRPFVGKTGKELNTWLDGDRLPAREDIFITNLYRLYQGKDHEWNTEDLARDEPDLIRELHEVQPTYVITMGRHSTRWFLGDVSLDDVHGIAWYPHADAPIHTHYETPHDFVIFPLVHLAAGFHNPEMSGIILYDFQELIAYFAGDREPRRLFEDQHPTPAYTLITHPAEILHDSCFDRRVPINIDTEGSPAHPWSIQYSFAPGTASVIRANRPDLVEVFKQRLRTSGCPLTYHASLHDLQVLRAGFGIETNDLPFDDTAVMAYLLQVEPKGLKPLCTRFCGMQMQSYEEILGDASNRLALDYFTAIWDAEQADYEDRQVETFSELTSTALTNADGSPKRRKDGTIRYRAPKVLPRLPKTDLYKAIERGLRSKTPRKLWDDWEDTQPHIRTQAVRQLGFMPDATLDHVSEIKAIYYGGRDADGTGRVKPPLWQRVQSQGLEGVYRLELSTYPLIDRMHEVGIKPHLPHFEALSHDLEFELADLQVQLEEQTGIAGFNANSGDQVATYLFDLCGLTGFKKTESGRYSTNKKVLEALEHEHPELPVITTIGDYREYYKLKSTFCDQLPAFTHRWPYDGRVHATFRTTTVVTGRLSASNPNLLAQPKHGKFANRFRRGWIPEEGHQLGEWDLSQVELRIGAHLSQDPYMLAVYRGEIRNPDGTPIDLHNGLAQRIFGVPKKDQTKYQRFCSKAINFGFWMGQTCYGLMVELRKNGVLVDEEDAQRWIDEANTLYAGAQRYKNQRVAEARRKGYVRCLSGRIRYIGGIKSWDESTRSEAERFAYSTPIQEGAAWLMKLAEASIWQDIIVPYGRQGRYVQPLLQVHDALDLEFEDDPQLAQDVNVAMVGILTRVPSGFSVPIETSGDHGYSLCVYDEHDPEADPDRDMRAF